MVTVKNMKKLCLIRGEVDKMKDFVNVIKDEFGHETHIMEFDIPMSI